MAHLKNRAPDHFQGYANARDTGPRYDRLSKADWADVFCDLWIQIHGEDQADPESMLADAERRTVLLKMARRRVNEG